VVTGALLYTATIAVLPGVPGFPLPGHGFTGPPGNTGTAWATNRPCSMRIECPHTGHSPRSTAVTVYGYPSTPWPVGESDREIGVGGWAP
jgi:hypothetical protein